MKDTTRRGWKRFGYLALSLVPMIAYLALMMIVSAGLFALLAVFGALQGETDLQSYLLSYSMHVSVVYAVLGLIVFGLWYYFGCKRKRLAPPKGVIGVKDLLALLALAVGASFLISYLLELVYLVLPDVIEQYTELLELAGIGEVSVMMILYVVILGPILEELIYRGITLFYCKRFTTRFWLANVVQALMFGIMHGNLVQGAYAFLLGLLLGWVYETYQSLYATMWMHIMFNLLGSGLMDAISQSLPFPLAVVWYAVGTVLFFVGFWLVWRKKRSGGDFL